MGLTFHLLTFASTCPSTMFKVCDHHPKLSLFQSDIQAPLNRQILQSSETIMYLVKLSNNFFDYFMGGAAKVLSGSLEGNGLGETDNMPRSGSGFSIAGMDVMQIFDFVRTLYNLSK